MPAIRAVYTTHPDTGVAGLWARKSNGQLVGAAESEWPDAKPGDTLESLSSKLTTALQNALGADYVVTATVAQLSPIRLGEIVIAEGNDRSVKV